MQLMFIILNKTECLETLLEEFVSNGIKGATIVDSKGMAHSLAENDEFRFVSSLRSILNPDRKESKTIMVVMRDNKVEVAAKLVNSVTGGISKPDTGIIFTVPISYCEGLIE